MAIAKVTLIGMYNYDNTIFEGMTFPEGINADDVINNLLVSRGEFEVLYPNPDFLKAQITRWAAKWQPTFTRWIKGQAADWNPIENYDRNESISDNRLESHTDKTTANYDNNRTANLSEDFSHTVEEIREHSVMAYDSAALSLATHDGTAPAETKNAITGTDKYNISGTLADRVLADSESYLRTSHVHGNIGVTQSSDMLKNWYDIAKWNLIDQVCDLFVTELLIPVY